MPKKTIDVVRKFYDDNVVREWERLQRRPYEFEITRYKMDALIRPQDSILDIGGGPGRYALHYAKKGCDVTLVDLSEGNVAFAREKAAEFHVPLKAYAKDARCLDELPLAKFDHVFIMGPMYHLFSKTDRKSVIEKALDHLKPGGLLYVSFLSLFAGFIYYLSEDPELMANDPDGPAYIRKVLLNKTYAGDAFTKAVFIPISEIRAFMGDFGLKPLHFFGQEGILGPQEKRLMTLGDEVQNEWLRMAKDLCEQPDYLGYSPHLMYIGKKPR